MLVLVHSRQTVFSIHVIRPIRRNSFPSPEASRRVARRISMNENLCHATFATDGRFHESHSPITIHKTLMIINNRHTIECVNLIKNIQYSGLNAKKALLRCSIQFFSHQQTEDAKQYSHKNKIFSELIIITPKPRFNTQLPTTLFWRQWKL